jgi:hypothetical protein
VAPLDSASQDLLREGVSQLGLELSEPSRARSRTSRSKSPNVAPTACTCLQPPTLSAPAPHSPILWNSLLSLPLSSVRAVSPSRSKAQTANQSRRKPSNFTFPIARTTSRHAAKEPST